MIIKRRHHSVPGLNTTATADISFMLLIFFLVASSMDLDKGLARVLPPVDDEEQKVETLVERDQLFTISLTANNQYVLNDQPVDLSTFHQQAADFMLKKGADHPGSILRCLFRYSERTRCSLSRCSKHPFAQNLRQRLCPTQRVAARDHSAAMSAAHR